MKIMYTELWFDQSWNDSRLAWNPDDWDGIKMLRLPIGELWKPDISVYNGKMDLVQNSVYDKMTRAVIKPDGKVIHVPIVKVNGQAYCISVKSSSSDSISKDFVALSQTRGRVVANRA